MIGYAHKRGIFRDPKLQDEFHENGFVIVPFISSEQIQELFKVYKSCYPDGVKGFFTTTFANNVEHCELVNSNKTA